MAPHIENRSMNHPHRTPLDQDGLEARMWRHYCRVEHVLLSVGEGQRCNWCMERELAEGDEQRPALLSRQPAGPLYGSGVSHGDAPRS